MPARKKRNRASARLERKSFCCFGACQYAHALLRKLSSDFCLWLAIIYGSFVTMFYFQGVWRMLRLDEKSKVSMASPPLRKSHVDASPESFGPQILNPYAKTQHEMKIATSFLQVPSFSKYVSKRFWDNPFTQPCLRIRSSRKTLQLDSCAVPEGSPSAQTADRH